MEPRFVTKWEREDFDRQQRGEAARGPDLAKAMARDIGEERSAQMSEAEIATGKLRQAIIDNTAGDLFWIGEILLSELEKAMPKLEVDAWDRRRLRIKQHYISQGASEEAADDKATADIRREIRGSR